jgi:hypothetical protein
MRVYRKYNVSGTVYADARVAVWIECFGEVGAMAEAK